MHLHLDKTLALWADVEVQMAKIHSPRIKRKVLLQTVLREFEEQGLAMRYRRANGEVGWKATPKFDQYLADAELDATEDLQHADF
jgi:hypothetical protein